MIESHTLELRSKGRLRRRGGGILGLTEPDDVAVESLNFFGAGDLTEKLERLLLRQKTQPPQNVVFWPGMLFFFANSTQQLLHRLRQENVWLRLQI